MWPLLQSAGRVQFHVMTRRMRKISDGGSVHLCDPFRFNEAELCCEVCAIDAKCVCGKNGDGIPRGERRKEEGGRKWRSLEWMYMLLAVHYLR